jgi:hypothetical protein
LIQAIEENAQSWRFHIIEPIEILDVRGRYRLSVTLSWEFEAGSKSEKKDTIPKKK